MLKEATFEEKIEGLKSTINCAQYHSAIVTAESLDQLIKAHELKYIEKVLEVEEELKLVNENMDDFLAYDEAIQKQAVEAYPETQRDPEYFERPNANKDLRKPCMILANIDAKKNEAKIKNWQVEYHARLIERLTNFRKHKPAVKMGFFEKLVTLFSK
jgi:hypothetical protein